MRSQWLQRGESKMRTSVVWRMPADRNPRSPDSHGNAIIQLQCSDRCSSGRRLANERRPIVTPAEVALPPLATRIEERDTPPGHRIARMRLRSLVRVAHSAGEPEVLLVVRATKTPRGDVLDLKGRQNKVLLSATISTVVVRSRANPGPNTGRYRTRAHASRGPRRPRWTASRRASALRRSPCW